RLVERDFRAVNIAPVDIVPVHLSIEVSIIETIVAVNINVSPTAVSSPHAPVIPVDRRTPYRASKESGKIGCRGIVIGGVWLGIVTHGSRDILRLIQHFGLVNRNINLVSTRRLDYDLVLLVNHHRLLVALQDPLGGSPITKLLYRLE